jgi:co-chaperonin GroES (HSP10)
MSAGYKPLRDLIIVKPDEAEKIGGMFDMPQVTMNKPLTGTVHAVGCGLEGKPMKTKIGDRVMFKQYGAWDIEMDGEMYLMMSEINDILCIL